MNEMHPLTVQLKAEWPSRSNRRRKYPFDEWLDLLRDGKGPLKILTSTQQARSISVGLRTIYKDVMEVSYRAADGAVYIRLKETPTEIRLEN